MKCPNCGFEHSNTSAEAGKRFRKAVEDRLVQYGFSENMSPDKYQASVAVRKMIAIRFGIHGNSSGSMSEETAALAIDAIDIVLPERKNTLCNTR